MKVTVVCCLLLLLLAEAVQGQVRIDGRGDVIRGIAQQRRDAVENRQAELNRRRGGRPAVERGAGDPRPEPVATRIAGGTCIGGVSPQYFVGAYTDDGRLVRATAYCPATSSGTPRPPSPLEAAYLVWHWHTRLPAPSLTTSPPGAAVTGLDTYLAIAGPTSRTVELDALGHHVRLEVTSSYDVDWGDGTTSRDVRTQGGPPPGGDLRHQYTRRGAVTLAVTQRWTARWWAGGQSGVLADRLRTAATVTMPVHEIQAVVER